MKLRFNSSEFGTIKTGIIWILAYNVTAVTQLGEAALDILAEQS